VEGLEGFGDGARAIGESDPEAMVHDPFYRVSIELKVNISDRLQLNNLASNEDLCNSIRLELDGIWHGHLRLYT